MDCDTCRALLLVYGDDKRSSPPVAAHLLSCGACTAFARGADELSALTTMSARVDAPALGDRLVQRVRERQAEPPRRLGVRVALAVLGVLQLAIVVWAWRQDAGAAAHEGHELNSLDAALAVGYLAAAWRPWRSVGLLPVVGAAALLLWVTAAGDLADGHTAWHHEATHLLTFAGFILLAWAVRPPSALDPWKPARSTRRGAAGRPRLRLLHATATRLRRPAAVLAIVATVLLGASGTAFAHVTVHSADAVQGGYAELTFRVPNERSDANVTKLEIALPADQPLASVGVQPKSGWTWKTTNAKLATPITNDDGDSITEAIATIVWTATGDGIKPGEFDDFPVSVGPLPKTASMEFKALQTYSNGTVVRWIQETQPGQPEPDNPAPHLALAAAAATDGVAPSATTTAGGTTPAAGSAPPANPTPAATTAASATPASPSTTTPTVLSVVALLVALAAAGLALAGRRRRVAAG